MPPVPSRSHARVWALCFFASLIEGYDLQSAGLAAPTLVAEQELSRLQLGWVFSGNTMGLFGGALIGGTLSDRVGRRAVLAGSLLAFGIFSIGSGLSSGFTDLTLMRFLTGLGLGAAFPNLISMIAEAGRPQGRAGRVTVVTAGMPLGGAAAALLVRFVEAFDWRAIFHVGGVAPILLAILVWTLLPPMDAKAVTEAAKRSGIILALFGEDRAIRTLALWFASFCTLLMLYLLLNWLPMLMTAQGLDKGSVGWAAFGFSTAGVCGAVLFGLLIARRFGTGTLLCGFALLAVSLAALAAASGTTAIFAASATGFFVVGVQFALYGLSADCYPEAVRGTGTGAAVAAGRLGAIAGPMLAGVLLATGMAVPQLLLALIPLSLLAAVATVILRVRLRRNVVQTGRFRTAVPP